MKLSPVLTSGIVAIAVAAFAPPAHAEDWNTFFGGIPSAGLITGELGYPHVPKAAYHHPISNTLTMGGAFAFGLGYYAPTAGTNFSISLSAPIRIAMSDGAQWTTALRLEPGLGFEFEGAFGFGLLLNAAFNAGYKVSSQFTVGPGIDVPFGFRLTNGFQMRLPLLLGGALEFHPIQEMAITFDMKFGPLIYAGDGNSGAVFGMKVAAGIAYHL